MPTVLFQVNQNEEGHHPTCDAQLDEMVFDQNFRRTAALYIHDGYLHIAQHACQDEDRSEVNISPIEVKSTNRYTLTSLKKCIAKYTNYLATPYVLHTADVKTENGITYLPLYMTGLL